jgi:hypothetical protein
VNPVAGGGKVGSIGLPAPGVTLRLVGPDGRDVPPGEVGEILVHGGFVTVGYWDDPEATAAAFQGGWLRTGDLARADEDGYYWFVGRSKEIIMRGGSNLSPLEVEEALYQHPAVREAGVVGVPDATWGEIVHAYVARKDGHEVTEAALKGFLEARIAAYKVPEAIRFLPDLPKGPTGKVARKTLRQRAAGAPLDSGPARKTTTVATCNPQSESARATHQQCVPRFVALHASSDTPKQFEQPIAPTALPARRAGASVNARRRPELVIERCRLGAALSWQQLASLPCRCPACLGQVPAQRVDAP